MSIVFVGGGNMAAALIGGMLAGDFAAHEITVVEPSEASRARLNEQFGVHVVASAADAPLPADALVLAVKPQQMKAAAAPYGPRLGDTLVVSIAAGLRVEALSRWLGGHRRLVRCMPNTPALIRAGITGLYADPSVDAAGRALAERLLAAVGSTVWLDEEARMDAVTAISGSGPAYVFHFIEALEAAAAGFGFDAATARKLAIDTVLGAARLAAGSDESPAVLRERVTSKGGTTAAALAVMGERDLVGLVAAATRAAEDRGRALGDELGAEA
ncbi:MAG: pyrroline-5-carboxylate reductase [Rhodocyclaceae bacterium]|nr:pyrroline-5-carboxylate reductase [Rhodocyclaceae bacterium]